MDEKPRASEWSGAEEVPTTKIVAGLLGAGLIGCAIAIALLRITGVLR